MKPKTPHIITRNKTRASVHAAAAMVAALGMGSMSIAEINATVDRLALVPQFGHDKPGIITEMNAALSTESNFSEALTTYATGFRDEADLDNENRFFGPLVQVTERFEYAQLVNADSFRSDPNEDLRPRGSDFPKIEVKEEKVQAKTENRGLQVVMEMKDYNTPGKAEAAVARLINRLKRNSLRRKLALLSAGANNTAKTWDTTAGKDPDQDVTTELIAAAALSGMHPNRVGYGSTAWSKRGLSHRAQNTAGGYASASLTPEALAGLLGVEEVLKSNARYTAGTARTEIVGALVLMFMAADNASEEDPSNIKHFWSPCDLSGEQFAVYEWTIGSKLIGIAVEHNEKIALTSTLGIRQFTIS